MSLNCLSQKWGPVQGSRLLPTRWSVHSNHSIRKTFSGGDLEGRKPEEQRVEKSWSSSAPMIDDMGAHHVLQTTRNPPVNAPRIRRSKNGFHASMALCPRVPGLHIAKSCSGSPHPARPTTRIRARQKRLQRLSRHSDTSDCSERLSKKERSDPNSVPTSSNPVSGELRSCW